MNGQRVVLWDIEKRTSKELVELDYDYQNNQVKCHVGSNLYIAGGTNTTYQNNFQLLTPAGDAFGLQRMLSAKAFFSMPHWEQGKAILTVGGSNSSGLLSEVHHYSIIRDNW